MKVSILLGLLTVVFPFSNAIGINLGASLGGLGAGLNIGSSHGDRKHGGVAAGLGASIGLGGPTDSYPASSSSSDGGILKIADYEEGGKVVASSYSHGKGGSASAGLDVGIGVGLSGGHNKGSLDGGDIGLNAGNEIGTRKGIYASAGGYTGISSSSAHVRESSSFIVSSNSEPSRVASLGSHERYSAVSDSTSTGTYSGHSNSLSESSLSSSSRSHGSIIAAGAGIGLDVDTVQNSYAQAGTSTGSRNIYGLTETSGYNKAASKIGIGIGLGAGIANTGTTTGRSNGVELSESSPGSSSKSHGSLIAAGAGIGLDVDAGQNSYSEAGSSAGSRNVYGLTEISEYNKAASDIGVGIGLGAGIANTGTTTGRSNGVELSESLLGSSSKSHGSLIAAGAGIGLDVDVGQNSYSQAGSFAGSRNVYGLTQISGYNKAASDIGVGIGLGAGIANTGTTTGRSNGVELSESSLESSSKSHGSLIGAEAGIGLDVDADQNSYSQAGSSAGSRNVYGLTEISGYNKAASDIGVGIGLGAGIANTGTTTGRSNGVELSESLLGSNSKSHGSLIAAGAGIGLDVVAGQNSYSQAGSSAGSRNAYGLTEISGYNKAASDIGVGIGLGAGIANTGTTTGRSNGVELSESSLGSSSKSHGSLIGAEAGIGLDVDAGQNSYSQAGSSAGSRNVYGLTEISGYNKAASDIGVGIGLGAGIANTGTTTGRSNGVELSESLLGSSSKYHGSSIAGGAGIGLDVDAGQNSYSQAGSSAGSRNAYGLTEISGYNKAASDIGVGIGLGAGIANTGTTTGRSNGVELSESLLGSNSKSHGSLIAAGAGIGLDVVAGQNSYSQAKSSAGSRNVYGLTEISGYNKAASNIGVGIGLGAGIGHAGTTTGRSNGVELSESLLGSSSKYHGSSIAGGAGIGLDVDAGQNSYSEAGSSAGSRNVYGLTEISGYNKAASDIGVGIGLEAGILNARKNNGRSNGAGVAESSQSLSSATHGSLIRAGAGKGLDSTADQSAFSKSSLGIGLGVGASSIIGKGDNDISSGGELSREVLYSSGSLNSGSSAEVRAGTSGSSSLGLGSTRHLGHVGGLLGGLHNVAAGVHASASGLRKGAESLASPSGYASGRRNYYPGSSPSTSGSIGGVSLGLGFGFGR